LGATVKGFDLAGNTREPAADGCLRYRSLAFATWRMIVTAEG